VAAIPKVLPHTLKKKKKIAISSPDEVDFPPPPKLSFPSSRTMALGLTQHVTEMSTTNFPRGVKGDWRVGLTASPPSVNRFVKEMSDPRRLTTLWVSTACYRGSFTITFIFTQWGGGSHLRVSL
jgi:hypothetical protein